MSPISDLIRDHPELVVKLRRFSLPDAARMVGALGLVPELLANTLRIEILAHLVITSCQGSIKPDHKDLSEWIGKLMVDSPASQMEDPAEDVFVGCVNSDFGSYRILQGNFGDGAFLVERLLHFFGKKAEFPTFQDSIDRVLALLRLADTMAERANLARYSAGGGIAGTRIRIPRWRDLEPVVKSVFFSNEDLQSLGISRSLIASFLLNKSDKENLVKEELWASSLELRPLLDVEGGVLVIEPSTLCRTLVRFMVQKMKVMGRWAETFYQIENSSIFVNEVGKQLGIDFFDFSRPEPEDGIPAIFPAFGHFDIGKPVIVVTYTPPREGACTDFAGFDSLSVDEQSKFQRHIEACAAEFEKDANFSGGMILVCFAGYGRAGSFGLASWNQKWQIHVATLRDWLALTADGKCTAMRLWKLGLHQDLSESLGVKIVNPAGLPNLFAYWVDSGFRLVQQQMDYRQGRLMATIDCGFALSVRVNGTQRRDEHCILAFDRKSWVRVIRHNSRALSTEDRAGPIYGAISEARKRLLGCSKRGRSVWWVVAPDRPDRDDLRDLLFQLWDCVLSWVSHLVTVTEREWPSIADQNVEVRLDLPDFIHWRHGGPNADLLEIADLRVEANQRDNRITLIIPEGFLRYFNVPKNVAEERIVAAIIEGASKLGGGEADPEFIKQLAREVVSNDDVRYFHIVETRELEQLVESGNKTKPRFVGEEDVTLVELGLADLVGRPSESGRVVGRDNCRIFLQNAVEKVWVRIEGRLRAFDRASLAMQCFRALDEITRDEAQWNLTSRAMIALRNEQGDAYSILRRRRSQWAAANLGNRLLIETSQYACGQYSGVQVTNADHDALLADQTLLINLAHHRDAIAYGFLKPIIKIHPNGEIEVNGDPNSEMLSKYFSHRSDRSTAQAAEKYDDYFASREQNSEEESKILGGRVAKLNDVFEPEFGFSIENLLSFMGVLRDFAIKSGAPCRVLSELELLAILQHGCKFSESEALALLDRLTLPIRSAWDGDLPERCRKEDVYPWRFRRHLSLFVRPLVQISVSPRNWVVSVPFFKKSVSYLTGNIERADFPERFFGSDKMRLFIGNEVNRRGHAFAKRVRDLIVDIGLNSKLEVEMTELGAPKSSGLGDVDVLAWNSATGQVFAIECKRLLPVITMREVIQRLEDFRGDRKERDSLGRHLRRFDWLTENSDQLVKITAIPKESIQLIALLVTNEVVPMQFFKEMDFPAEQVIPYENLTRYFSQ